MCGIARVEVAADALDAALRPERSSRQVIERGLPKN
jgi:hypothetical protein